MKAKNKKKVRRIGWVLLFLYVLLLSYFLFFAEIYGRTNIGRSYSYNYIPFKEIRRYIVYADSLGWFAVATNLIGNVIGFIPVGFCLTVISAKCRKFYKIFLICLGFTVIIECCQLFFRVGSFDVDDMILNTFGGIIGYFIFIISNYIRRRWYE